MFLRRLATIAVISTLPFALVACGEKTATDPRTESPLVRFAYARMAEPADRSFTGVISAKVESDLGFRVSGKILERLVDGGQIVKRGQVLMRIDPADLNLAAKAQKEMVAAAKARAQQTADEELRYRDLRGTGAISASTYDLIKSAADSAKAQLSVAEAQSGVARNATQYTELIADSDGVVMETLAEPGQVVNAGQPVIRLAHDGKREAVIQLPETLRPSIGDMAKAALFGNKEVVVKAKLRQLSNTADPLTRTFEARYVLDNALSNAPLGATIVIQIPDKQNENQQALTVPIGALFDAGKGPGVWVIQGEPTKVTWRQVVVQRIDDDSVHVSGQIKPGDRVVALGAHLLREGEQVRVATPAANVTAAGARL